MNEKRFLDHNTSRGLRRKSQKQEHERENEMRCEIAGNVFEKRKERRARSAKHRALRIKQASCGLYSFCEKSPKPPNKAGRESEVRSPTQIKV